MNSAQAVSQPHGDIAVFRTLCRHTQAKLFRRNVMVAASLFMAFACWDLIVAPMSFAATLEIRTVLFGYAFLLFLLSGVSRVRRWYNWYFVALISVAAIGVAVILRLIPGGFAIGIAGIVLVIGASSAMFGANPWAAGVAGAIATLGTVGLMIFDGEPTYLVRSNAIFLVVAVGVSVFHGVQAERRAYEVFQAQGRLKAEKELSQGLFRDLTTMRQQRLTWLESLAQFLRHELKNQLVAMGTSIDLARSGDSLEANRIYLDRAQRSLNRMRGLVSSATEATSLEAALTVDEVERVDLSALVADRVLAFQEANPSKRLDLGLNPGLFVQGNEARIAQLLDKLLNNAAEHMKPGGEIRVTLRRADGHWFELCVENEGNALPEDKERIFEAFVSSRRGPENLGIGLFVARSIARNHGGTVVAEELPGAAGARFVVRLPEARVKAIHVSADDSMQAPELEVDSPRDAETDSTT